MKKRTQALLDAVYADPARDELRSVLADHLIEENDPRGEFIALQLESARTGKVTKREQELQKKHAKAWIGTLDGFLAKSELVFRRGFLARGRVDGIWNSTGRRSAEYELPRTIGAPEWATVEEFACPRYGRASRAAELLTHPTMRSLRTLHNISIELAEEIEKCETPPPLVEVGLTDCDKPSDIGKRGLRGVRSLVMGSIIRIESPTWLFKSPLWPRLEKLAFFGYGQEPLDELQPLLASMVRKAPKSLRTLGFMAKTAFPWSPEGWHVELSRDDRGTFSRLTAAFGAVSYGYAIVGDQLAKVLERFPVGALTSIEIRKTRAYKPSTEQTTQLAKACERLKLEPQWS